jgi:hypothetical protein
MTTCDGLSKPYSLAKSFGITKVQEFCPANHVRVIVLFLLSDIILEILSTLILTSPRYTSMGPGGYISSVKTYVQLINKTWNKEAAPGPVALNILEVFIHNESLSTYQIYSKLKFTRMKMAYKNVHKIIQRLLTLGLLVKTKKHKRNLHYNDHNAKYYKLSEFGIFRLFLMRPEGILVDRLSFETIGHPKLIMDKEFSRYYNDCELFRAFLSPVMDTKLLPLLHINFLHIICDYLHQCCKTIENILLIEDRDIPVEFIISRWNAVLDGLNNSNYKDLLLSLREKFELEFISLDEYVNQTNISIKGERDNELIISNPRFKIRLCLDREKKRAVATHIQSRKQYEYVVDDSGSDAFILDAQSQDDFQIKKEFGGRKQLNSLVYQMVDLISIFAKKKHESEYEELSRDKAFMNLVDNVYSQLKFGRAALLKLVR